MNYDVALELRADEVRVDMRIRTERGYGRVTDILRWIEDLVDLHVLSDGSMNSWWVRGLEPGALVAVMAEETFVEVDL